MALKRHPETRVIFMSGYADRALDDADMGKRSVQLQKPFSLQSVLQTVRRVLDNKEKVA
jgi:DNA-binding NtrC family response regulator